jgi:DNA-binding helix-hairpin-helix protein with protein kinase domain
MEARTDSQRISDLEEMVCVLADERRELARQVHALELIVARQEAAKRARKLRSRQRHTSTEA